MRSSCSIMIEARCHRIPGNLEQDPYTVVKRITSLNTIDVLVGTIFSGLQSPKYILFFKNKLHLLFLALVASVSFIPGVSH